MANNVIFKDPNLFRPHEQSSFEKFLAAPISLRCPHCRHIGSFVQLVEGACWQKEVIRNGRDGVSRIIGNIRRCPNPTCQSIVFTLENEREKMVSFPPELIEFDESYVPPELIETLREAIICHANGAFRASAMMVRRLLEEICEIAGVSGKDLHSRLEGIKGKASLPEELFEAMFELKALGNDAAHIQAKAYEKVGREEALLSIALAKEILKSLFQMKALLAQLKTRAKHK